MSDELLTALIIIVGMIVNAWIIRGGKKCG